MSQIKHGTVAGYNRQKCRLHCCREAYRQYREEQRAQRRQDRKRGVPLPSGVEHGKASTYQNWECKCRACGKAHARLCQLRRDRAKERTADEHA